MRKPRGAAFKGSFRYKRTLKHYGKRKIINIEENSGDGQIIRLNEPAYSFSSSLEIPGFQYTYSADKSSFLTHE